MKITIVPYTSFDGLPTFTDSFIKNLFVQMEVDDTVKTVFFDGSVTDQDEFLRMMKHGANALFVVYIEKELVGFYWLNNFEPKSASFHFCFFSNVWGKDTVEIGKACIMECLNMKKGDDYDFDLLTGLVPERNEKAIKWCECMEFEKLGRLPCSAWIAEEQKSEPAIIFYAQRGKYNG